MGYLPGLAASTLAIAGATLNSNNYSPFTISSGFSLLSGTFTAPAGTWPVPGTFNVAGGTFNHNNGVINFNGSADRFITCAGATFNSITFTHTAGTKTVRANCALPLGINPSVGNGGSLTLLGMLSGSGTITTTGTLTLRENSVLSGFTGLNAVNLTIDGATFNSGSYSPYTVSGTYTEVAVPSEFTGYYANMPAAVVIGQADFAGGSANQGGSVAANTINQPKQVLVVNDKLFVADDQNHRVLIYNSIPTENNTAADLVLGFTDFVTNIKADPTAYTLSRPSGLATDGEKLFILDRDNHRLLIYNSIPNASGVSADVVVLQSNMESNSYAGDYGFAVYDVVNQSQFSSGPTGLAYNEELGKLIVNDTDNNRVLIFNSVQAVNGGSADVVVGQADFTGNRPNRGTGAAAANTIYTPTPAPGVTTYKGKLIVVDGHNNRVLIFNTIPTSNNASADVVIGQADFTSRSVNQGGSPAANTLNVPRAVKVDSQGRLFIVDATNNRILVFNQIPTTNNASADQVIGQPNFTSNSANTTNNGLSEPRYVYFYEDQLIVSDGQHRVLIFNKDTVAPSSVSAPTFGAVSTSSIEIIKPSTVTEETSGLYQWQPKRDIVALSFTATSTASVIDSSLSENTQYTYTVRFKDNANNNSSYGTAATKYTLADVPSNLSASVDVNGRINLTVDSFLNDSSGTSGYYFENITANSNSGWVTDNTWLDRSVICGYNSYSVKYRNADGVETSAITINYNKSCGGASSAGPGNVLLNQAPPASNSRTSQVNSLPATNSPANGNLPESRVILQSSPETLAAARAIPRNENLEKTVMQAFRSRISDASALAPIQQQALSNFIVYGTLETQSLGLGERAGTVYSFQAAFNKLPQTEQDWSDILKISLGRWPSQTSADRENQVKADFKKVYLRDPEEDSPRDQAAIDIMAYGLRPANRNLNSEKTAAGYFKAIYGNSPKTTSDWDIIRSIAYSGATR